MDTQCTKPEDASRVADETSSSHPPTRSRALALPALSALFALFLLSGCSILFPPSSGCPDTEELCPNLDCENGPAIRDDGCAICECAGPPVGAVCWDASECRDGLVCDTDNFCETPPGCEEGQPCPAVCYGRCAEPTTGCADDSDCDEGEECRLSNTDPRPADDADARPAPEDEPGGAAPCDPSLDNCGTELPPEEPPPPEPVEGVCVPATCDDVGLDFPACPPGTAPVIDFSVDECGLVRCVTVDDCRDIDPDQCDQTPGCHTEGLPVPCDCAPGEDCACPAIAELVCVPDAVGCEAHSPEECELDPDCEGHFFGGMAPCIEECDDNTGDCFVACPEPDPTGDEGFVCLPRDDPPPPDGECTADFDCADGQRCEIADVCGGSCEDTPNGTVCTDECTIIGFCVDDPDGTCGERPLESCENDNRCVIDFGCDAPTGADCAPMERCVPREPEGCFDSLDCGPNESCELETFCPECNDPNDIGCLAPCWLEGRCIPLPPPPPPPACDTNDDCGSGYLCEQVEVCEGSCAGTDPGGNTDPAPGVPCEQQCWTEGQCLWNPDNVTCFFDGECGEGEFCAYFDNCGAPPDCPNCLIACMGVCEELPPAPTVCMETSECDGGQVCDTVNYCETPPGCGDGLDCPAVCYGRCVDDSTGGGTPTGACLEQADCDDGFRCATELDSCFCPEGQTCDICYWQCVEDTTNAP
jgi:hypothetical protein